MHIHRDVADIVNHTVLRDVIQIHGKEIPYPAELWVNGNRHHEDGTAMFSIGGRGFLTAEYFGYDVTNPREWLGLGFEPLDAKLIMKDTGVEIPIWWISSSRKARTWHSVPMPAITVYECEIKGRLGASSSEVKSVSITVTGLPDVHLFQMTSPIPEESTAVGHLTLQGFKKQFGQLNMEAGEWQIKLTKSYTDDSTDYRPLHHVHLSRKDGSAFVFGDDIDNGIINALQQFLSFQCGRWVDLPTIVCSPVFSTVEKRLALREGETDEAILSAVRKFRESEGQIQEALDELNDSLQDARGFENVSGADILGVRVGSERAEITFGKGDPTVKMAWVGRLSSHDGSSRNTRTATDTRAWPSLFDEFWNRYIELDNREHLKNSLYHYLEAQRVFDDGSIGQALVAAQSTLQALTRWWNDVDISHRFGPPGPTFDQLLIKAVQKAELGKDSDLAIDEKALPDTIKKIIEYRNDIDHGRGRNIQGHEQSIVNCQMHHHNLARLLILAKLGNRDRDARGYFTGPQFTEVQK